MTRAGGNATAAGMEFQAAAAAWYCVQVLAEEEVPPPFGLPASATLQVVRCEVSEPVDDILVETADGGYVFAQCKHALNLSTKEDSELASAIDQFVRQFLANRVSTSAAVPWQRRLDPNRDRLVVVVGVRAPDTVIEDVPSVLTKVRGLAGRPIDDAPTNAGETNALRTLKSHVTTSWRVAMGTDPTPDDIRELLSLVRIEALDFDARAETTQRAREWLRRSVLAEPSMDAAAWDHLVARAISLAKNRTGVDRSALRSSLTAVGLRLRAPHSYADDIERLRKYTAASLDLMRPLSELAFGTTMLKIQRECQATLWDACQRQSVLVTGEPGAGKSGLLYEIAARAVSEKVDCVVLLADRISAHSLERLQADLGLTHPLVDVLSAWSALEPALLIIDALDAAREEHAARTIRDLLQRVEGGASRWRVVASIRKFDLRYGEQLRRHFLGSPPALKFADSEFTAVRHVNVALLTRDELGQISAAAPALAGLVNDGPAPLRELLLRPFNLRLAADLLSSGLQATDLNRYRTQLDLLDRYWLERVISPVQTGDAREALLKRACEAMLINRSMQADRSELTDSGNGTLTALLSNQVLTEWQSPTGRIDRYQLSYSHHVLHDYAMARLLLRGSTKVVIDRLKDPDFSLFARPSVVLHFQHLWAIEHEADRPTFWEQSLALLGSGGASRLANLVPSTVAAERFSERSDLDHLCDLLAKEPAVQGAADFLNHIVGALITNKTALVGSDAAPWSAVVVKLAEHITRPVAFSLRTLLLVAIESTASFSLEQLTNFGAASRLVLSYTWRELPDVHGISAVAIQAVCRTFESSTGESETLIRLLISPERLRTRGYIDFPWLAREIGRVVRASPGLARDVYIAAFEHVEGSAVSTPMGGSRILSLTSNQKQDYESGLWSLGEAFPEFLTVSLTDATHAVVAAIRSYVEQHHRHGDSTGGRNGAFSLLGTTVSLATDISEIWDSGDVYAHDNAVRLLSAFDSRLRELDQAEDEASLRSVLSILVADGASAVFWRRLLVIAADGDTLLQLVAPLLSAPAVLTGPDTAFVAGELLDARFAALDAATREAIERAVLSLPDNAEDEFAKHFAERHRARLLGCLQSDALVTDAARLLLAELRTADAVPANQPSFRSEWITGSNTEEDHLTSIGISLKVADNAEIVDLAKPVREFNEHFLNSKPASSDIAEVVPYVARLYDRLRSGPPRTPPGSGTEKLWNHTWGRLASVCKTIAIHGDFSCTSELGTLIRAALLDASENQEPEFNEAHDKSFAHSPGWGTPAARIDAAIGLLALFEKGCADGVLVDALQRLAVDQVAPVRFQIATHLAVFMQARPDLLWSIAEQMVGEEQNRGVLRGLTQTLAHLAGRHSDRIADLLIRLRARTDTERARDDLEQSILAVLAQLYVYRDHAPSRQVVRLLVENISTDPRPPHPMLHYLRASLTYDEDDDVRKRAFALFLEILERAKSALRPLLANWSDSNKDLGEGLAELIRGVADQVYFASGAFDEKRAKHDPRRREADEGEEAEVDTERFYREAASLLDSLADVDLVAAAHHVIETLAFFVPVDPRGVFMRIARSLKASKASGYQYESLAATLVVEIVERYLAEYRYLFRDDPECRLALLEILDGFIIAGWPNARRLVYRLDEIFR